MKQTIGPDSATEAATQPFRKEVLLSGREVHAASDDSSKLQDRASVWVHLDTLDERLSILYRVTEELLERLHPVLTEPYPPAPEVAGYALESVTPLTQRLRETCIRVDESIDMIRSMRDRCVL